MQKINLFIIIIFALGASACRALRPLPLQPVQLPTAGADTSATAPLSWRNLFTDPQLVALIDTALVQNYDRRIAFTHIRQAEAELLRARAPLLPQVDAMVSAGAERFGDYTMNGIGNEDLNLSENVPVDRRVPGPLVPDMFVGFRAAWEIDIWGRLKAGKERATAQVLANAEGLRWLNTNLVAGVATLYYELLALDAEVEVARQNADLQQRALEIMEAQKAAGRATELAVQQFRAQIFNTQALQIQLQQRIVLTENALRVLLGRYEGPISRGASLLEQDLPSRLRTGVPSRYLLNRPDVRQSEQELLAARADLQAARAAMLPNLVITPYAGLHAFRASALFLPESAALGLLGGLAAPVFNRRGLLAERNSRQAQQEAAWLRYQRNLITAYNEVQNEVRWSDNLQRAYPVKLAEVQALDQAVEVSKELYLTGYANYLEVITAQKSALQAAIDLQELRKNQFINIVNLYRALGGG